MAQPRVLILRAPGVNCDLETAHAFQRAGAETEPLHVQALLQRPARVRDFQVLCLPGGFSYGDDLAAGRILGNQIRFQLADVLAEFRDAGKLILGICNGFQILIKSGILLADRSRGRAVGHAHQQRVGQVRGPLDPSAGHQPQVRVLRRDRIDVRPGRPRRRQVRAARRAGPEATGRVRPASCCGTRNDSSRLSAAARRSSLPGQSQRLVADIAGVCDATGRVCGLMPHPERHIEPTQHPRWTRRSEQPEHGDGFRVFQNAVAYFR